MYIIYIYIYIYIYICIYISVVLYTLLVFSYLPYCSHHKQLNGNLKGTTFVVLAVYEQVAPMSSS